MLKKNSRIFVAGHNGMVGSSILRKLKEKKYTNIITMHKKKLNLLNQNDVKKFFQKTKIEHVILAAARVGGIYANNTKRAQFLYENLTIQNNVMHYAYESGVKNLIFLGSSCVYPNTFLRPIKESDLLSNYLEKTNEPYAIAKLAGIKMCENYSKDFDLNYKCLMPCNLFGINDNFDLKNSHFIPGIMHKIYLAKLKRKKKVVLFGTGSSLREVMYVDDLAEAVLFFLKKKTKDKLINIGSGYEKTINFYIKKIQKVLNAEKIQIIFDQNKELDGTKRKLLNTSLARKYQWKSKYSFDFGIKKTYDFFLKKIVTVY